MMVGGIRCDVGPSIRCPGPPLPQEIDNLTGARTHTSPGPLPSHYLEIENLTRDTARMEFHAYRGEVFRFAIPSGEVKTVFRGRGSSSETGEEDSPLPEGFFHTYYAYDSIVVVVRDRREVFFRRIACNRSDGCDPPVFENSPGWESSWNPFIRNNWELVEEPYNYCGVWVNHFYLRPK